MSKPLGTAPAMAGSWSKLSLTPWISEAIVTMGIENMTPVQASTIPRAIKNQDCVVEAVTGSGKTLAFVVPILERLCRAERKYKKGEVAAIVIAPTRELAVQIHSVFQRFLSTIQPPPPPVEDPTTSDTIHSNPTRSDSPSPAFESFSLPMLVTSGTQEVYETFSSLSSNIIVGTPGRLAAFLLSPRGLSQVRVNDLDVLVLDEADRLLSSPDHRRDVERIMGHLPKQRRTHLFSATMTDAVEELIGIGLRNPVRIVVNLRDKRDGEGQERRLPARLENKYLVCGPGEKTLQLVRLLKKEAREGGAKFIVYFSTCAAVDYFYRILTKLNTLHTFHFTSLHGDLPPWIRTTALNDFTSHASTHLSPAVLLCTDVAARGVDFEDTDVVIQYDPPTDPKAFSHRAGRTARAGRAGRAFVLLTNGREEDYVDFMSVRKMPLTKQMYLSEELEEVTSHSALDTGARELLDEIRGVVKTDRELADRGAKAYVSSLRAYTKHEASFIFRLSDMDFHGMAMSYGLLRLPAMPEINEWRKRRSAVVSNPAKTLPVSEGDTEVEEKGDFITPWEDADIDWDNFSYSSKDRENARLVALEKKRLLPPPNEGDKKKRKIQEKMRESWSVQKDKKSRKEDRRIKRDVKKQREHEERLARGEVDEDKSLVRAFEARVKKDREEEDSEYRLLKKEIQGEKVGKKRIVKVEGLFGDLD
ncbi:ATP-dependent rRNA helicase SPB4 [Tremella mesenterica]|uniref:ATP-dependent RNA helicase n=1 Tax=Tremella mesenterica TaxID=5217 RepID=A0A4Q1BTG0_TREME|nr:ATP-dependent rRNA helicase SPB4 [Tremella mesenterica]